ncbi:hypothetical protein LLE87_28280, partial [Paenibacillus polymyxa]|nr:hypothetical protein [Paenibacillus polymyxa]
ESPNGHPRVERLRRSLRFLFAAGRGTIAAPAGRRPAARLGFLLGNGLIEARLVMAARARRMVDIGHAFRGGGGTGRA